MVMNMCGGYEAYGIEYKGTITLKSDISVPFVL